MNFNKFSFRGIQDLCRVHHREFLMSTDRDKLKAVLENRRVRFISPLGYFDYAYFGEFTFEGDVMILWTKKSEYPLSTYILCIVLSEKKNALITKKEERDNKNKAILRETKL